MEQYDNDGNAVNETAATETNSGHNMSKAEIDDLVNSLIGYGQTSADASTAEIPKAMSVDEINSLVKSLSSFGNAVGADANAAEIPTGKFFGQDPVSINREGTGFKVAESVWSVDDILNKLNRELEESQDDENTKSTMQRLKDVSTKSAIQSLKIRLLTDMVNQATTRRKRSLAESGVTVNHILERMDAIRSDNDYIRRAIEQFGSIETFAQNENATDEGVSAMAQEIAGIVVTREETNRRMLAMLEKMYDDLD